jgi:hypothetical protein
MDPPPRRSWRGFAATRRRIAWLSAVGLLLVGGVIGGVVWWERSPVTQERVLNAGRWPASNPQMRQPGRLRVLFIGNSLTQYNGSLPLILQQMAASAQKKPVPVFDMVYRYGGTWAQMWDTGKALDMIHQGRWDYVVLQDYSTAPMKYRAEMDVYARRFSREIYAVGARPIFFMTWPHQDQLKLTQQVAGAYISVSEANDGVLAPVGLAWMQVLHDRPWLTLYDPGDRPAKHPTAAGSYLAACVFYSVLYHQSPVGLTNRIVEGTKVYINLKPADAVYLQEVAWKTVLATGRMASTQPALAPAGPAQ